jgi:hypothetical protein
MAVRVYAVCRNCAEVHPAELGCPRCARRALLARPDGDALSSPSPSEPTATPTTSSFARSGRSRMWRLSTAVIGGYVLLVLGLIAAVLLDI